MVSSGTSSRPIQLGFIAAMCIATLRARSSEPPRTCRSTPILLRGGCAYAAMRAPSTASKRAAPATMTFSFTLPDSSARSVSRPVSAPGPFASTASRTLLANARNSSLFETASVSQPTATMVPRFSSSAIRYPTFPSGVGFSARFAPAAIPFSRRTRTAASMSPFVSCSARLQSIIGAPVWSRSSLTSAAEISAIRRDLLHLIRRRGNLPVPPSRLPRSASADGSLRDRLLTGCDLLVVALRHRLLLRGWGREVSGRRLLLACRDSVGDDAHDQVAGADRVVVAGDDVVGFVGIAVRVDDGDHGQAEPACLAHGELLLAQVDDEDRVRLALHLRHAAEVLLELLELTEHRDAFLRRQQVELALLLETAQLVQA